MCAQSENDLDVNFSNVIFSDIAHFVGISGDAYLRDIAPFELHRSRIPSILFKAIVKDMDLMLMQYGSPILHNHSEEACAQFIAPVRFCYSIDQRPASLFYICKNADLQTYNWPVLWCNQE